MKDFIAFIMFMCSVVFANAQATDLVVDCQNPGWLSSKINFGDQMTVKNLKVTGYINSDDLKFIGTLIENRSLNGTLDLFEVNIVGSVDNYWDGEFGDCFHTVNVISNLNKLTFPNSLESFGKLPYGLNVEILVFDTKISELKRNLFAGVVNNIILGNNISTINTNALMNKQLQSVQLPSSLKIINDFAFNESLEDLSKSNISVFPNLEYMGYCAFANGTNGNGIRSNKNTLPDSIFLPNIIEYHISAFDYKENMHIFLGENIKNIYYSPKVAYSQKWYPSLKNVVFHIASLTPPNTVSTPSWNDGITVFVPKEAVEAYKNHSGWRKANIVVEPDSHDTSSISELKRGNEQDNYQAYDLAGRKVNQFVKGKVYIVSGKKFIVH